MNKETQLEVKEVFSGAEFYKKNLVIAQLKRALREVERENKPSVKAS